MVNTQKGNRTAIHIWPPQSLIVRIGHLSDYRLSTLNFQVKTPPILSNFYRPLTWGDKLVFLTFQSRPLTSCTFVISKFKPTFTIFPPSNGLTPPSYPPEPNTTLVRNHYYLYNTTISLLVSCVKKKKRWSKHIIILFSFHCLFPHRERICLEFGIQPHTTTPMATLDHYYIEFCLLRFCGAWLTSLAISSFICHWPLIYAYKIRKDKY